MRLPDSIVVIEPVPYLDMIGLMRGACAILTDSGGIQKEAFFLEVPCLTYRNETEWVETVECNANRLLAASPMSARAAIEELRSGAWKPGFSARPYGAGNAAGAIVASLVNSVGVHRHGAIATEAAR
jgi:UDP-N-acetylglucosamine 2-epimerase